MINLSLKTKFQIAFIFVGLASVSITGWLTFKNAKTTLESISAERLTAIREIKKQQIETYFANLTNLAVTLSENKTIIDALTNSINFSETSPAVFGNYLKRFNLKNLFLVNDNSSEIVYSSALKHDDHSFEKTIRKLIIAHGPDKVSFTDFAFQPDESTLPCAYITSPVYLHNRKIGLLILQISIDEVNTIMTNDNNWKELGFGATGETYLVGNDFRMRSDSRFYIQDSIAYFKKLHEIGTEDSTITKIRFQHTSILIQSAKTIASANALNGQTATKQIKDYRGVDVVSSYAPINIAGLQWVIITEIDEREAFASIYALRENLVLLGVLITLLALIVSLLLARNIAKPMNSVTKAIEQYSVGNLSYRNSLSSQDEFGVLGNTLNDMAEKILESTISLQNEISQHKQTEIELIKSEAALRNLTAHLHMVREGERKGIAREIHDELGQSLNALKIKLSLMKSDLKESSVSLELCDEMIEMINVTIKSVKKIITELRPQLIDDLGLVAAIEWQIKEFARTTGTHCELIASSENIPLENEKAISVFRILQEALTNIARHAQATHVDVVLSDTDDLLELSVVDNGIGMTQQITSETISYGLIGMRERALYCKGNLSIDSIAGKGTTITLKIPKSETI